MSRCSADHGPLPQRPQKLLKPSNPLSRVILLAAVYGVLSGCSSAPVVSNGAATDSTAPKVPLAPQTQSETIAEVTRDELGTLPPPTPEPAPAPTAQEIAKSPSEVASKPEPPAPVSKRRQPSAETPQASPKKQPKPPVAAPVKRPAPPSQKALPVHVKPEPITIEVTLENLPTRIRHWILDRPPTGETTCILKTPPLQMEDGAGGTPVTLQLTENALVVFTRSNIDLTYEDSRISIGEYTFTFDAVDNDTNAIIRQAYPGVIKALDNAKLVSVALGFWPTWPKTTLYQLQVPVEGFSQAYQAWQSCNKLL